MASFTNLTHDQCFGKNKLEIFKKRGVKAEATDFAVLSGATFDKGKINGIYKKIGYYWTGTGYKFKIYIVTPDGEEWLADIYCDNEDIAVRPVLSFSSVDDIPSNGVSKRLDDGFLEVEYGYYPQEEVNENVKKQ